MFLLFAIFVVVSLSLQAQIVDVRILDIETGSEGLVLSVETASRMSELPLRFSMVVSENTVFQMQNNRMLCASDIGVGQTLLVSLSARHDPSIYDCESIGMRPSIRKRIEGRIGEIALSGPEASPKIVGMISIRTDTGKERAFLVHKYTIIMVNVNGYIYVTELRNLKPGWKCSLTWNADEEDSDESTPEIAADMIVEVSPEGD